VSMNFYNSPHAVECTSLWMYAAITAGLASGVCLPIIPIYPSKESRRRTKAVPRRRRQSIPA
jgi:hypothetical protein